MGLFKKKSHNREPEELPPEKVSESIIPRAFLHSHTSRVGVATSADGSAVTAETSGTLETRQQWAPALRNISELIRDWDRELSALDPSKYRNRVQVDLD